MLLLPQRALFLLEKINGKVEEIVDAFNKMVQAKTQLQMGQTREETQRLSIVQKELN